MLIACPNCSTSYMIDPASLGEAGRTVRCARCKTTWFASKPEMVGAGSDDEPTSATGVIRPDREVEDTVGQEQTPAVAAQSEETAQAPVTVTDAPPMVPAEPPAEPEVTTEIDCSTGSIGVAWVMT